MTPLAAIAAPQGFSRHGHIYVPTVTAQDRANLAWFGEEAQKRVSSGGFGAVVARLVSRSAQPACDPWFGSNYQANISHYFGAPAEELYLPGEPASGAITGKIAGNVLSPVTSPLYRQTLSGAHLGAGFDAGTTDSFDAANSSVHSYSNLVAYSVLIAVRIQAVTVNELFGKRSATLGYEAYLTTGRIYHTSVGVVGSATPYVPWVAADWYGIPIWLSYWWSPATNAFGIDSSIAGGTSALISSVGDTTNASTFALGSQRVSAAGFVLGLAIIWSGADAETVIAARTTTLPAWWAEATA